MKRRFFLQAALAAGGSSLLTPKLRAFDVVSVANPLNGSVYPTRDWEKIYRDQYHYDSTFTWVCAPNDTHMCRLRSFVRNGVMLRSEQNYDHDKYTDLYGNHPGKAWNPRGCPKGYTMHRRVYSPYRLKGPVMRKGWKDWADAGFPSLSANPELRTKYKFDDRGNDTHVHLTWDQAYEYVAKGIESTAKTYSGDAGKELLLKDGFDPLMIDKMGGAGTMAVKFGSNLPIHGIIGKFGLYRFCNSLGLLDHHVRGVPPEKAVGGRMWNEYTWRGDQGPGHPYVHGLQTSDMDMNNMRFAKMIIMVGKNLIENKMPEAHWTTEVMERGGIIVDIAPEYNSPAQKCNYWIGVRPGLADMSIFLGVSKMLIDEGWYDADFVRKFTDFPLLVRTDNLKRLRPEDVVKDYKLKDLTAGPSYKIHGLTDEQRDRIGDFCVWDPAEKKVVPISRDQLGDHMPVEAALEGALQVKLVNGETIEVMPIFEMYKRHLADYDLKTVEEICGAPAHLVRRLTEDIWNTTKAGHPVCIHHGEGINHYFHATLHNRACFMTMMLTGNIGNFGGGVHTWSGNYKGAVMQGSPWSGPGVGSYIAEDPFKPVLDEKVRITHEHLKEYFSSEEPAYWACGQKILSVDTPKAGHKVFTGKTHMPTPTKVMWYNNTNFINQAKWVYNIIVHTLPKVDMIVDQQVEWTGSAEYADIILPANGWVEFEDYEMGASCSNPFLQVWKGGIKPLHNSRDDAVIFAGVSDAFAKITGDRRFIDYFKYIKEKKSSVYLQRILDNSMTTRTETESFNVEKLIKGEYGGEPGAALLNYRTYPRVPFYEQIHDSIPFYTDCGRLASYCDIPEAIEYGENLIVHREAVEATPYLPNVIVSSSPYVRPVDYGIPLDTIDADLRQVRNVKMPWSEAKKTVNPLWAQGYRFYVTTPKSRHSTHSSWSTVDWQWIWSDNFGDPYRADKRAPGVADRQIIMNPDAAAELGLTQGDYV
ncbi:MAG: molybdopterin-dependent oxidoreductase, partial [Isosphaeraceae bacterium]